jgi:hypothetical protein
VIKAIRVALGPLVLKGLKVRKAKLVLLVLKGLKESRAHKVKQVLKGHRGLRVTLLLSRSERPLLYLQALTLL